MANIKEIRVMPGQSYVDIALSQYGCYEGLFRLLALNNIADIGLLPLADTFLNVDAVVPALTANNREVQRFIANNGGVNGQWNRFIAADAPPAVIYEPETGLYMAAIGIANDATPLFAATPQATTSDVVWTEVDDFFKTLKDENLFDAVTVARLFVGDTASQHKFNSVTPADTNAAHRAQFFGGGIHSATGYKLNGTNAYADGNWKMTDLGTDSNAIFGYQRLNLAGFAGYLTGSRDSASTPTNKSYITTRWTDSNIYIENNNTTGFVTINAVPTGLTGVQRISSSEVQTSRNTTLNAAQTLTIGSAVSRNMFEGAINNGGSPTGYGNNEICFIGALNRHLTPAEHVIFATAIQDLQIGLKRHV